MISDGSGTLRYQINVHDAYDFSAEMSSWTLLFEPWTLMISTNFLSKNWFLIFQKNNFALIADLIARNRNIETFLYKKLTP